MRNLKPFVFLLVLGLMINTPVWSSVYEMIPDTSKKLPDTTVIEAGKIKVIIIEDEDGNEQIKVLKDGKDIETNKDGKKTKKKLKTVRTRVFLFELGLNGYAYNGNLNMPPDLKDLELNYGKSININIHLFRQRVSLIHHKFNMMYGLSLELNDYAFRHAVTLEPNQPFVTTVELDRDPKKSKLASTYLMLPILLNYESNPYRKRNSFRASAGVYGGFLIWGRTRQNYKKQWIRTNDDFNMNQFRYGITSNIGFSFFNIYFNYALSPMFRTGEGPELQPFSIGLIILGF